MTTPRETELKFELETGSVERLRRSELVKASASRPRLLVSTYFDTASRELEQRGISLRIRRQGRRLIQTIKADAGNGSPFERAEWECDVKTDTPDPSRFAGTALEGMDATGLSALFVSRVRRSVHLIETSGAAIEVAIDDGRVEICAGGDAAARKASSFLELELELKRGDPAALFALARDLNGTVPLRLGFTTKCGRGYMLLDDTAASVSKSEEIALDADTSVETALRTLARECIRHLVVNTPALLERRQVEAVHQMRVAIRRLRAAMSLFRSVLGDPQTEAVKGELKWIGRELGEARNLDVFIGDVVRPMLDDHPDEPGMSELLEYFQAQRVTAYDKVVALVRSERFGAALIDTLAWIEAGEWAQGRDESHAKRLYQPVRKLAAHELSRRWRKIERNGRKLKSLSAEERHQLRIDIKKVRYAAEFFASLYHGRKANKRRKHLSQLLAGLQDSLGELNDMAVNHRAELEVTRVEGRGGAAAARRRSYAAGMLAGKQFGKAEPLLRTAIKDYGRFKKAEPFWDN